MNSSPLPAIRDVYSPLNATPGELTAAAELARLCGSKSTSATSPGMGVMVALASRDFVKSIPLPPAASTAAWMWLRLTESGSGEIIATHGSFLYAAARLLTTHAHAAADLTRERLAQGVFIPASFGWHRPHWDACYAQYWRSARGFDPEQYVATLAESGFTHAEVNSLQAHMPYEDLTAGEYYPQFYTYLPGFNHFVDTPLTRGLWPAMYLDANLEHLKKLAALAVRYGLKPGVCMFEPRTMPERFFQKFPSLRGARVDHPFRSRLPRYTMAQDHPIVQRHYREALQKLIRAVPELSYMSVWTNDSGAGFEHTASLYVGRNGGPYLIREWRNHEKVAEAAGQSIVRYLQSLRIAAAKVNPDFDIILRIEPFKVEHDHILTGMGKHVIWEAPSLLVRGYSLPYTHPKYPDNPGVAGSIFHVSMDAAEKEVLQQARAQEVDPVLHYSASGVMNHEPLLGLPFPRLIHAKLAAARRTGVNRISALGGLANTTRTPYWPNPVAIRAAQFFPDKPIDDVLTEFATQLVGAEDAETLTNGWHDFEDALIWQPLVPLYCSFGFCWQRTWDRPLVPDIEAIPPADRDYYERHGCFQHNNPGLNDLGKDVLFDLITRESGAKMAADMDRELLPRVRAVVVALEPIISEREGEPAQAVFVDFRDRVRAYLHWATTLRNVCAWCECVHGWLATSEAAARSSCDMKLQETMDLEIENTRGLIKLMESSRTEFMVVSSVAENTFLYGENLIEHLRAKIQLMEKYRHLPPRIDRGIFWRPVPGTTWPEDWST